MSTTIAATLLLIPASVAGAATIKVTTTADDFGGATECSLREAVTAANFDAAYGGCKAGSGADEIRLQSGSVYVRSIDGNGEDGNATGDLDVTSKVTIGPRKGRATIDALGFDRVLEVLPGADLTLSRITLTGATETYPPTVVDGMGVRNTGGKLKTSRVKIIGNRTLGNSANNGGGLVIAGGKTILDRTTIADNVADNVGGGIALYQGNLTIKRSSIAGNASGYSGGGLYLGGSSFDRDVIKIQDSTIAGNEAGDNGGGIYASVYGTSGGGTDEAKLTNVTISGNASDRSGGGVYQYVGQVSLLSSTVTANTADADASGADDHGGGLFGSISFRNSIVFGNEDLNPVDPLADCGNSGSGGHNVIGAGTGCVKGDGDRTGNPKLKPLSKNGGPTATHALRKGSSAIGLASKRDSPKRDQRGVRRDKHPDSGAYEFEK